MSKKRKRWNRTTEQELARRWAIVTMIHFPMTIEMIEYMDLQQIFDHLSCHDCTDYKEKLCPGSSLTGRELFKCLETKLDEIVCMGSGCISFPTRLSTNTNPFRYGTPRREWAPKARRSRGYSRPLNDKPPRPTTKPRPITRDSPEGEGRERVREVDTIFGFIICAIKSREAI